MEVTKKDSTVLESGLVIQNIKINPVKRSRLDIENWRNAHQHAEAINGDRIPLYDLYDDVLLDPFLHRMMQNRILGVTKNKLQYLDRDQRKIPFDYDVLASLAFRKLRIAIQKQKAWGIAVIELINDNGKLKIFDVPKKHIDVKEGKILTEQYGNEGIFYRNRPYSDTVIEIGDWDDLGYLLEAACYALYKRGDVADWANYAQIFGMPFREARYDGFNEHVRIQLENALEKAASAAWIVLPKEAEFTLHKDSSVSGSSDLFNSFRQAMNEEIMVSVLGATETTTSSSRGYAQSKTHKKTVGELNADDMEDELSILNSIVAPVLIRLGLLPDGGKFCYCTAIDLDIVETRLGTIETAKAMGTPISDDFIYKLTGIPKPDNYDELKAKK